MNSADASVVPPQPRIAHQYIVGYEVHIDGHPFWWGHLAIRIDEGDPLLRDPQALLDRLCALAAARHDARTSQVRLKMVSRL